MQTDPTQGGGVCTTRSVSRWERALLTQWFANTDRVGDQAIAAAYVSESSHDDPYLRNMIVIAEQTIAEISYLIHRPNGETAFRCPRQTAPRSGTRRHSANGKSPQWQHMPSVRRKRV
jgi:hypothetical protein